MNGVERSNDGVVIRKCPFCGGEAELNVIEPHIHVFAKMPDYHGGAFIECSKCTCAMSGETSEEVIKAWNNRKPVENVIGQIEELKKAFQEGYYTKFYCSNRLDKCVGKDCSACVLERAIEIIKQELI